MKKLFLLSLCTLLLAGCSGITTSSAPDIEWLGFYYKNQESNYSAIAQEAALEKAPRFTSIQNCLNWGKDLIANNPNDGFDCSYGCRFEEDFQAIVCKDTTKMIIKLEKPWSPGIF